MHIQTLHQELQTRTLLAALHTDLRASVDIMWVCRLVNVCLYSCVEGKTACWFVKEGPADSPDPAGVGLKPPADVHAVAVGLIACPSSLKGKAAVRFVQPLSAFTAEQSSDYSQNAALFPAAALFEGLFCCFSPLVSDLVDCIDPRLLLHTSSY